jgi:transcription initiation factor TFIIIB Brf1 subunit/transcription initiation factor TFIIB
MNQWIFTREELYSTPSVSQGFTPKQEATERTRAINFIEHVAHNLRVPINVTAVAQTLLHRFYMRNSFKQNHAYDVASACIFLACKVCNEYRRLKDVVQVVWRRCMNKSNLETLSESEKEFVKWTTTIIFYEQVVLEQVCFDLNIITPFPLIDEFCQELQLDSVKQLAIQICSDSFVTNLCLRFTPEAIAASCILVAGRALNIEQEEEEGAVNVVDLSETSRVELDEIQFKLKAASKAYQSARAKDGTSPI